MNIVLILACMAVFYNIDLLGYNSEYLSVQQTKNLKGIFTLIVLFHHLAIFASVGDVYNIFKLLFCKWVVIIRLFTMFRAHCISISHFFWRQNCHFYKF